jgi:predicted  nucleic acid-binding Zn-ribbon protein
VGRIQRDLPDKYNRKTKSTPMNRTDEKRYDEAVSTVEWMRDRIVELEDEVSALESKIYNLTTENDELDKMLQDAREEIKDLIEKQ